jgi:uncharacterized membrane protein YesL
MNLFLVKKTFFDMWDNMLTVFVLNIGFVLVGALALYLPFILNFNVALALGGTAIGVVAFFLYTGAASLAARNMVDYQPTGWKEFIGYFKDTWKASLLFSAITIVQVFIIVVAFPFYANMGGFLGIIALALIFWVSVFWWIAGQFYYPIRARLDSQLKKVVRKSFVMLFDNTFFSLILAVGTIAIVVVSGFTAFLLPGITTVLIWHQGGMKLRLLKYDYLEENPEADRKKIPWDALLIDEKERVGHRTLRGMIFPWKE